MRTLIARFMGPTWGPSGADRTQVGPMSAPWTLLSGMYSVSVVSMVNAFHFTDPLWGESTSDQWRALYDFFSKLKFLINTLRPRQNDQHFPNDMFKCLFLFENVWIWIKISRKFVPKVRMNNIPALVQIMAWRRIGDKPLSEPMMVNLLTHICVTQPQWVKPNVPDMAKLWRVSYHQDMVTSWHGIIGPLYGESICHLWIPHTKGQ